MDTQKHYKEPGAGMKFFFTRIFPMIFIGVGFGLFWKGTADMELAKESVEWPFIEGRVVSSEVVRKTSRDSDGHTSTTYHAEISYEYTVGGTGHYGDKVSFGDYGSSSRSHAAGIVGRYPEGKQVLVYYKPDKPSIAVLETGVKGGTWIMPIIGSIFGIVGVVIFMKLPAVFKKKETVQEEP